MHDYSIDNHPKEKILFFLAFAAILTAPIINSAAKNIVEYIGATAGWSSATVTAIPVFVLFSLLYWCFNKYLWRISLLRRILLVPDLNGVWSVEGATILKNGEDADFKWSGKITVTQSWSKLLVYLQTDQSASNSVSASMHHEDGIGYRLLYQYENAPGADQRELAKHSGSTELLFNLDCQSAEGHYYTDQHRNTVGVIKLRKVKK